MLYQIMAAYFQDDHADALKNDSAGFQRGDHPAEDVRQFCGRYMQDRCAGPDAVINFDIGQLMKQHLPKSFFADMDDRMASGAAIHTVIRDTLDHAVRMAPAIVKRNQSGTA